jgi:hypothetical protein
MTNVTTTGRFAFRATPEDIARLETIAVAMRAGGEVFATRTDALRKSLEIVAADTSKLVEGKAG